MINNQVVSSSPSAPDRRRLIGQAAALGAFAFFGAQGAMAQDRPNKGGVLRLGMAGGSASDSLDPRTYSDSIANACGAMFWNYLVEIDENGAATPELAESWESKPGALEWIFNIRKGITFASGKTLDADDVIYSINLHRGETKSPAKGILAPYKNDAALNASIAQLREQGHAVVVDLLADASLRSELNCDRELILRNSAWVVVEIKN